MCPPMPSSAPCDVYTTLWGSQKATMPSSVRFSSLMCPLQPPLTRVPPAFLALGYLFGFTLARLQYLSFNGVFCSPNASGGTGAAPGECYYYLQVPFKIGESSSFLLLADLVLMRRQRHETTPLHHHPRRPPRNPPIHSSDTSQTAARPSYERLHRSHPVPNQQCGYHYHHTPCLRRRLLNPNLDRSDGHPDNARIHHGMGEHQVVTD